MMAEVSRQIAADMTTSSADLTAELLDRWALSCARVYLIAATVCDGRVGQMRFEDFYGD